MNEYMSKISHPSDPNNPNTPSYVSGDDYVKAYQLYIKQYPGRGSEFTTNYPPDKIVTPGDRGAVNLGK